MNNKIIESILKKTIKKDIDILKYMKNKIIKSHIDKSILTKLEIKNDNTNR